MISYPLELNKLQFCILNNQRIRRVQVPSAVLPLIANSIPVCMALGTPHLSREWKSASPPLSHTHLLPQGTAKLSLNPGSSEVGLEQTGKRRQGWVTAIIHNQERKPTVWHWNRCWEDVSLSSQDLGSPSVTQTARDSQGQSEPRQGQSEPRQAMAKDRDRIINFGRAHQVSLQCCHLAGWRKLCQESGVLCSQGDPQWQIPHQELRPRGGSHPLPWIFIIFACRTETTLVRNRDKPLLFCLHYSPLELLLPLTSHMFSFLFGFGGFFGWWWWWIYPPPTSFAAIFVL